MPADRDELELRAVRSESAVPPSAADDVTGIAVDVLDGDVLDERDRELLGRIGAAVRTAAADPVEPAEPPPEVWDGIVASLGLDTGDSAGPVDPDLPLTDSVDTGGAEVIALRPRRRGLWLAAAAATVVVAVLGLAFVLRSDDGADTVVATVELEDLDETGTTAQATLIETSDGSQLLEVDVDQEAPPGAFIEVWLIDTDVTQLISLGPVSPDGRYDLPPGLDVSAFPVVDLSREPFDGDPAHSGDSVLRGVLPV